MLTYVFFDFIHMSSKCIFALAVNMIGAKNHENKIMLI